MSNDRDNEKQSITDLVDKCASQLGEHVDTVQVMVTKKLDDGTNDAFSYWTGHGNLYTRLGHVREFLLIQDEYARIHARKTKESESESD